MEENRKYSLLIVDDEPVISDGIKELFEDKEPSIDCADILRIAENLDHSNFWTDTFAEYEIFFDPDGKEPFNKGRNDPLSWAIAFAELFIAITAGE